MPGFEIKAGARKLMSSSAPKLFFIGIVFIIISTVMSELQFRLPGTADAFYRMLEQIAAGDQLGLRLLYSNLRPPGVALAAVIILMSRVIDVGYMSYCLKTSRGQGGDYKDLLDGFLYFGKIILISIMISILRLDSSGNFNLISR